MKCTAYGIEGQLEHTGEVGYFVVYMGKNRHQSVAVAEELLHKVDKK